MSNVKLSKSAASVTDNDTNNNNNGHVTVAHTSYRDATASDVVKDQPERSMNWEKTQQSTVTMVYHTIHYCRWMIDDSWLIIDYGTFRLAPIVVTNEDDIDGLSIVAVDELLSLDRISDTYI